MSFGGTPRRPFYTKRVTTLQKNCHCIKETNVHAQPFTDNTAEVKTTHKDFISVVLYRVSSINSVREELFDGTVSADIQFTEVKVVSHWKLYDDVSGRR